MQLLKERKEMATLQLTTDNHLPSFINPVHLKDRLGDIETNCRNRMHG